MIQIAGATICFSTVPERGDLPKSPRQILRRSWRTAVSLEGGVLLIALNHALLGDFAGARFGIPVAAVRRLLAQRTQAGS